MVARLELQFYWAEEAMLVYGDECLMGDMPFLNTFCKLSCLAQSSIKFLMRRIISNRLMRHHRSSKGQLLKSLFYENRLKLFDLSWRRVDKRNHVLASIQSIHCI